MAVCEKAKLLLLLWCGKMREMSDDGPLLVRGAAARWRRRCMCCWRFGDVAEGFVSAVERSQAAERAKRMATRERRKDGLRERVLEDVVAGRRGWGFFMGEVAGCAASCETVSGEDCDDWYYGYISMQGMACMGMRVVVRKQVGEASRTIQRESCHPKLRALNHYPAMLYPIQYPPTTPSQPQNQKKLRPWAATPFNWPRIRLPPPHQQAACP